MELNAIPVAHTLEFLGNELGSIVCDNTFGTSNLAMILVLMNLTTVEALISVKASASAHFV